MVQIITEGVKGTPLCREMRASQTDDIVCISSNYQPNYQPKCLLIKYFESSGALAPRLALCAMGQGLIRTNVIFTPEAIILYVFVLTTICIVYYNLSWIAISRFNRIF